MKENKDFLQIVMRNLLAAYTITVFVGCYLFVVMDAYQNELPDDSNFGIEIMIMMFMAILSAVLFMIPVFMMCIPSLIIGYIVSLFLLSKNIGSWILWMTLPGLIAIANIQLLFPSSESRNLYLTFIISAALCGFLMRRFSRDFLS